MRCEALALRLCCVGVRCDEQSSFLSCLQLDEQAFVKLLSGIDFLRSTGNVPDDVLLAGLDGKPFRHRVHPRPIMLEPHIDAMSRYVEGQSAGPTGIRVAGKAVLRICEALVISRRRVVLQTMDLAVDSWQLEVGRRFSLFSRHGDADCRSASNDLSGIAWLIRGTRAIAGANQTDGTRIGLYMGYIPAWVRQQENPAVSMPPELLQGFDAEMRQLLGIHPDGFITVI